jgi:membrane-bound serine protease (ClpP class)
VQQAGQQEPNQQDQKPKVEKQDRTPLGTYITVRNPVDTAMSAKVTNAAISILHQAEQEGRTPFLILEITRGTSTFGQVYDLARKLTSAKYAKLRTIAWIDKPADGKPIDGHIVLLALACSEIIMHPDAEIGNINREEPMLDSEKQSIISIVESRRTSYKALALGMMDAKEVVLSVKLELLVDGHKVIENRVVTPAEMERLRRNKITILDVNTVWEAGEVGIVSGQTARNKGVLVTAVFEDRAEIARHYGLPPQVLRENALSGVEPKPVLIDVRGMIDERLESFVTRHINRAVAEGANLIIFQVDSPGGRVDVTQNLMTTVMGLESEEIRTVAYIERQAFSGAAMFSLACDEIYMAPDAKIGDAAPISVRPGGPVERAPEKILSVVREMMRSAGKAKGRPPGLLEAMADKDMEIFKVTHRKEHRITYMNQSEIDSAQGEWIKGDIVPESRLNNLLTVSGTRAHELMIAEEPVADMDELKSRLGIPADMKLTAPQMTWVDDLVRILNWRGMMFLLFFVGVACIYFELHTMSGFFGIAAAVCFGVFFWSRFLGGTAGWLEVTLFLLGIACIALEIFVIPGFGVFGVSGGVLVVVSLILASQTFVIPRSTLEVNKMVWTMGTISGSLISVIVMATVLGRFLPQMPLLNKMILAPPDMTDPDAPLLDPSLSAEPSATAMIEQDQRLVNLSGISASVLRPAGKAHIDGQLVDVVTEGAFIDQGTAIEVIEVSGNRVVVRQA